VRLYRDFTSQEQLDAEYNTMCGVADPAALFRMRQTDSDAARRDLPHVDDLAYGPTLAERLDIYPADTGPAPTAIFFHGGYWSTPHLVKGLYGWVARGMRARGIATVVVDYAPCPTVTIDEIVRQARAAVVWIHQFGAAHGCDPQRLYGYGHSAGGHLAAMLVSTDWQGAYGLPHNLIRGGAAISGLFDLAPFPFTWLQPKLQLTGAEIDRNSPIRHTPPPGTKLLLTLGGLETPEFHRQARTYQEFLTLNGSTAELMPIPACTHNTVIDGLVDPASPISVAIGAHMQNCFQLV
jgi:arylformamidase